MSKDTRQNNLAFPYKVKRGHQGSIFIRLSRLLSQVPALLSAAACKWAGCNSKCGKEVGEFRPLDSHCPAIVGYSVPICPTDCLSISTAPPSQLAALKVSVSPRPIQAGAAVLQYITHQQTGTCQRSGPPLTNLGLAVLK